MARRIQPLTDNRHIIPDVLARGASLSQRMPRGKKTCRQHCPKLIIQAPAAESVAILSFVNVTTRMENILGLHGGLSAPFGTEDQIDPQRKTAGN
jgi:hypothetical protein